MKLINYDFVFSKDNLDWCCNVLGDYPDFIPTGNWGSLKDSQIRKKWKEKNCDQQIGGKSKRNCKGIE